ncbi:hypothetical protein [Dehalococcoides mccartyi]|nr:hypothetical protein [Dehalococcoides mccartyi]MBA2085249.1 hypothetical protein [Dehalococcoides mccartyi]BCT56020.1 hypothetical protein DHCNIT_0007830 [Dehalococcoides mccartyi]BEL00965.1 hypothetical protein DMOBY_08180 [Dehalococcoides mccartyi]
MKQIAGVFLILLGLMVAFLGGILHITGMLKWLIICLLFFCGWELTKKKS